MRCTAGSNKLPRCKLKGEWTDLASDHLRGWNGRPSSIRMGRERKTRIGKDALEGRDGVGDVLQLG